MALARDAVSEGVNDGTGTTLDVSHTATGTGTTGLIIALTSISTSGGTTVSSVVWDQGGANTPFTQLTTLDTASSASRVDIWYLKAPATGTKTVRMTTNIAQPKAMTVVTYTGVDQTTPLGTPSTEDTTGTSTSINISSAAGNFVIDISVWKSVITEAVGGGQTQLGTTQTEAGSSLRHAVSEEAGAGTTTMSWSWSGSVGVGHIAVEIKAAATGNHPLYGKLGGLFVGKLS